jgi:hypothetical protein
MSNEEEALPTVAHEVIFEREHLDSDGRAITKHGTQKDKDEANELVRRKDVEELVQGMLNEFKNNRDDAGALRPCDADIFEERLTKFLNEVQSE